MEVFVLIESVQQLEFTNQYGEQAMECETVIGIFDSLEKVQAAKEIAEVRDAETAARFDCDPSTFYYYCMIVQ